MMAVSLQVADIGLCAPPNVPLIWLSVRSPTAEAVNSAGGAALWS